MMHQSAYTRKNVMLNRHIEQPFLTDDTPHFFESALYLRHVMENPDGQSDIKCSIDKW